MCSARALDRLILRTAPLLMLSLGLALAGGDAAADIATDGTVGPRVELTGPEFAIGADLGTRAGDNLFHSFERFSLATGEGATFTGPNDLRNVISRVTGGERSNIDGALRSASAGADFYFINPAGVLFGPNATGWVVSAELRIPLGQLALPAIAQTPDDGLVQLLPFVDAGGGCSGSSTSASAPASTTACRSRTSTRPTTTTCRTSRSTSS